MKFIFFLLLLALCQHSVNSFDCPDIPNQEKCDYLSTNGCVWTEPACSGNIGSLCTSCYFVDSVTGTTGADGSFNTPFPTIQDAITAAGSDTVTIYILNYLDTTDVHLLKTGQIAGITITGLQSVLPLFPGNWTLNLSRLPLSNLLQTIGVKVNGGASMTLKGAIISYNMTMDSIYLFEIMNAGILTFEDVSFVNSEAGIYTGQAVRTQSAATTAIFNYNGGAISNSNLKFSFVRGNINLNGLKIFIQKIITGLFTSQGSTIVADDFTLSDSESILLFSVSASGVLQLKNSFFENSKFTLLSADKARTIEITDCTFQSIQTFEDQFIQIKDVSATDSLGISVIKDTLFEDISVAHSLFLLQKNSAQLTLTNVRMINLTKYIRGRATDIQIEAQWPGGLCGLTSADVILTVENSKFINISSHCFGLQDTTLTFSENLFDNSKLVTESPQFTSSSITTLTVNSGISWVNIKEIRTVDSTKYQAIFERNTFKNNAIPSLYGGAIRFIGTDPAELYAVSNVFIGNMAAYGGAIYADNPLLSFSFTDNQFEGNIAYDGGAIYKVSQDEVERIYTPSVSLSGDQFIRNQAIRNGGAAYFNWESMSLSNGKFDMNKAQNGGGIYYLNLDDRLNADGLLTGTRFTNNYASNVGGAMKIFFGYPSLKESSASPTYYNNNSDAYSGPDVSTGKPSYYVFSFYDVLVEKIFSDLDNLQSWTQNSSRTSLKSQWNSSEGGPITILQKSGHEVNQIIEIAVYDESHSITNYIIDERVIAKFTSTSDSTSNFEAYLVASPVYLSFQNGGIYIKTALKMVGEPNSKATLNLRGVESGSNMLKSRNLLMDFNFEISFTDCEVGDIYDSTTKTCDTCSEGTYSFDNPYSPDALCIQCDITQQLCLGGSKVSPQPGYWRYDAYVAEVLPCPEPSACLGGLVDEIFYPQGKCNFPYEGNLCNSCAVNYAKFGSDESCSDCKSDSLYYIKFLAFFALRIGAMVFSIKVNLAKMGGNKEKFDRQKTAEKENKESKRISSQEFQSNLMKIVVNFLQVSTIIFQYRFDWPDFVTRVINVTNKFIPISSDGFSVDCIVAVASQDNTSIYFIKLVVTLIEPLGLWCCLIGIYLLYLKYKKETIKGNPKVRKNLVVLFVITAFIVQPSLIQSTLELFKCTNLKTADDTAYFMTKDPNVQCWSAKHVIWSVGIAFPFFLLWGVILPLILFKKLRANADCLESPEVYSKYAFVYEGLKPKRYYWEFAILIRKTLIIIIFVFLNVISIQAQAFSTFLVILAFTALQVRLRPYANRTLNQIELFSLVNLLVMAYCGMFFLSGGTTEGLTILLIIISLIFNILFYTVAAFFFLKSYRRIALRFKRSATQKVKSSHTSRSQSNSSRSYSDEKDKPMNQVKDIEAIMAEIESPKAEAKRGSHSNISDIPGETDEDYPTNDKKVVYRNNVSKDDSTNMSSVVRNFGFQRSSFGQQNVGSSPSFGSPSYGMGISINNSSLGLLNQPNSAQSSARRLNNLTLQINSENFLKPRPLIESPGNGPDSRRSGSEFLDSPLSFRNLGFVYEDSPRLWTSRPRGNHDDPVMLKIPNYPSNLRKKEDGEDTAK